MTQLDWLWPLLSSDERQLVESCLGAFECDDPDRKKLIELANDSRITDLEKRYLPQSQEQIVEIGLKHRVLICSVGLRPMPVILSTLLLAPTKLYLLHSRESRRYAEEIRDDADVQRSGLNRVQSTILHEISLTDAPQNYSVLQEIIKENPGAEFVVDVSGGVKVMGVSLATAAFWLRLPVVYLLGREIKGVIKPFSERLTHLQNPFTYFGSPDFRSIVNQFSLGEYDAAIDVCRNLQETVGDVRLLGKLDILIEFIEIYRDWDLFLHSAAKDSAKRKLATRLRSTLGKMKRLGLSFANQDDLHRNLEFLEHLERTWKPNERNNSEPHRLVDVFAAAQRRAKVGKFDDALARCYRCLEMTASIALMRDCHINNTHRPDLSFFIDKYGSDGEFRKAFKRRAGFDLNEDSGLGLKDQMTLLYLSGRKTLREISEIYLGMEKNHLMEKRNRSTLAHGTIPVAREEYEGFEKKTRLIISYLFGKGEFTRILDMAEHPPIELLQ